MADLGSSLPRPLRRLAQSSRGDTMSRDMLIGTIIALLLLAFLLMIIGDRVMPMARSALSWGPK
jgi:hypothetical protein